MLTKNFLRDVIDNLALLVEEVDEDMVDVDEVLELIEEARDRLAKLSKE